MFAEESCPVNALYEVPHSLSPAVAPSFTLLFLVQIRELASELLTCYFPPTFPESIAAALFECAQEAVSSPRVQEGEAGAVLMKTVLQK